MCRSDFTKRFARRRELPFLRSSVPELHGIGVGFEGEHPTEVSRREMSAAAVPEEYLGVENAHYVVTHASHITGVHE
jgi:hypothetical protein